MLVLTATFNITIMRPLKLDDRIKYKAAIERGYIDPNEPQMHNFCGTWMRKHPRRTSVLDDFKKVLGHNPEWEDLSDDTLYDFRYELEGHLAPNSVKTICGELKAVINANVRSKNIPSQDYAKILTSKKVPTQGVYLTTIELRHIHEYIPASQTEAFVKEIFMRECLTGARNVDCRKMSMSNIVEINGMEFVRYVPQKHPVEVTVPVHKWLKAYLTGNFTPARLAMRMDLFNECLRRICFKCNIVTPVTVYYAGKSVTKPKYKLIASHTGRRTFATLLSLKGCQIEQIAQMMGHMNGNVPNISMTAGYILAQRHITKSTYNYFK